MLRKNSALAMLVLFFSGMLLFVAGCNQPGNIEPNGDGNRTATDKKPATRKDQHDKGEHGHKAGTHGGIIVSLGTDSYHMEAVFEKGGLLKLFTLGKDEAKIIDIESQVLKAYVKEESANEAVEMDLNPVPRTGDKPGRTSQFIGKLPADLVGKAMTVTIPIVAIDGERFRVGFTSATAKHDEAMPSAVGANEEKDLYLKPGGIYTLADIKANGNQTASQKFKGIKSRHDMRPKEGDKICPVTKTKANPQFTWIVNGKAYEFCCPPCVDEFVSWAKTQPDLIKAPEEYVKRK
jgi:hypothetical protein